MFLSDGQEDGQGTAERKNPNSLEPLCGLIPFPLSPPATLPHPTPVWNLLPCLRPLSWRCT